MKKFILSSLIFFAAGSLAFAETMTLTTYYPAPYCRYMSCLMDEFQLRPLVLPGGACTDGTLRVDENGLLRFCTSSAWNPINSIWDQDTDGSTYNDIYLVDWNDPNIKIGIGTQAPEFQLHFSGNGSILAEKDVTYTGDTLTTTGAGIKFIYYPAKGGALRAGRVDSTGAAYWDDNNIGLQSVAFGNNNMAAGPNSGVLSGNSNKVTVNTENSAIVSGQQNEITQILGMSIIGAGQHNKVYGVLSGILAGSTNTVNGGYSVIAGGTSNVINGNNSFIGAGGQGITLGNLINGYKSGILAGADNEISSSSSGIVAGFNNIIETNDYSGILSGYKNKATGLYSAVVTGTSNTASGTNSAVAAGGYNTASGIRSFVGGGGGTAVAPSAGNIASGQSSFIGAGAANTASGSSSAVVGGAQNTASGSASFIGGGSSNTVVSTYSAIGGGINNEISHINGVRNFIGGGQNNKIPNPDLPSPPNPDEAFIGGGLSNTVNASYGVIAGGSSNTVGDGSSSTSGWYGTIVGGGGNQAYGDYSFVGTGANNHALGDYSIVPGGQLNKATGDYSFAGGWNTITPGFGSFVWNTHFNTQTSYAGDHVFMIFPNSTTSGGVAATPQVSMGGLPSGTHMLSVWGTAGKSAGGTTWAIISDRKYKKNIQPVSNALNKIVKLRGVTFEWKDPSLHGNEDKPVMGFIAQEVEEVMPEWVMETEEGDKLFNPVGINAMLIEAIKELKNGMEAMQLENQKLQNRIKELEDHVN